MAAYSVRSEPPATSGFNTAQVDLGDEDNALSPGIVDSGAWNHIGDHRDGFFDQVAANNPARRIGQPADISSAALLALTNPFLTGTTLHIDGGGRLA